MANVAVGCSMGMLNLVELAYNVLSVEASTKLFVFVHLKLK